MGNGEKEPHAHHEDAGRSDDLSYAERNQREYERLGAAPAKPPEVSLLVEISLSEVELRGLADVSQHSPVQGRAGSYYRPHPR
jgi:hypothetical protein